LFLPIESGLDLTMDEKIARIHDILKPRWLFLCPTVKLFNSFIGYLGRGS
jgi:hypothetical protein